MKLNTLICGSILGICLSGTLWLTVIALYFTSASNVAFITALSIVFVPLLSVIFLKRLQKTKSIAGAIIGLTGLIVLVGRVNIGASTGDLFALASSLCLTGQIILIDKFNAKNNPLLLDTIQIVVAALIFILVTVWGGAGIKVIELS